MKFLRKTYAHSGVDNKLFEIKINFDIILKEKKLWNLEMMLLSS